MLRNPVEASSMTCSAKASVSANHARPKPDAGVSFCCMVPAIITQRAHRFCDFRRASSEIFLLVRSTKQVGTGPPERLTVHGSSLPGRGVRGYTCPLFFYFAH